MANKPIVNVRPDSESIISMVLGAMVVVVIGALLFSYIRDWRARKTTANAEQKQDATVPTPTVEELPSQVSLETNSQGEAVPTNLPAKYVVKKGDTTWKIAVAFYGSGFNYVDIEQANNLKPETKVAVGQELTIPKVAVRTAQTAGNKNTKMTEQPSTAKTAIGPSKGDDSAAQKLLNE